MREILLTKGKKTLVDDKWFDYLNRWKWIAIGCGKDRNRFYAARMEGKKIVWMHRVINNTPKGMLTDHINGDSLYNLEANLRTATHTENMHNQSAQKTNTSGYKGVTKSLQKWMARIAVNGKRIYLGTFTDPVAAASAYNKAAKIYHKEFANIGDKN